MGCGFFSTMLGKSWQFLCDFDFRQRRFLISALQFTRTRSFKITRAVAGLAGMRNGVH